VAEWLYGSKGNNFCHQCKVVAKKTKKEIDCDSCSNKMPEVPYELQALLNCFIICEYQLKMGYGGPYALDYSSVLRVADDLGVKTNATFYRLLKAFENVLIKELNKKSSKEEKAFEKVKTMKNKKK
jgi:hypothetical protein